MTTRIASSDHKSILDLKYKLISLGTLKFNGFNYSAEGGVLNVSKDALVLMKDERHSSIYI